MTQPMAALGAVLGLVATSPLSGQSAAKDIEGSLRKATARVATELRGPTDRADQTARTQASQEDAKALRALLDLLKTPRLAASRPHRLGRTLELRAEWCGATSLARVIREAFSLQGITTSPPLPRPTLDPPPSRTTRSPEAFAARDEAALTITVARAELLEALHDDRVRAIEMLSALLSRMIADGALTPAAKTIVEDGATRLVVDTTDYWRELTRLPGARVSSGVAQRDWARRALFGPFEPCRSREFHEAMNAWVRACLQLIAPDLEAARQPLTDLLTRPLQRLRSREAEVAKRYVKWLEKWRASAEEWAAVALVLVDLGLSTTDITTARRGLEILERSSVKNLPLSALRLQIAASSGDFDESCTSFLGMREDGSAAKPLGFQGFRDLFSTVATSEQLHRAIDLCRKNNLLAARKVPWSHGPAPLFPVGYRGVDRTLDALASLVTIDERNEVLDQISARRGTARFQGRTWRRLCRAAAEDPALQDALLRLFASRRSCVALEREIDLAGADADLTRLQHELDMATESRRQAEVDIGTRLGDGRPDLVDTNPLATATLQQRLPEGSGMIVVVTHGDVPGLPWSSAAFWLVDRREIRRVTVTGASAVVQLALARTARGTPGTRGRDPAEVAAGEETRSCSVLQGVRDAAASWQRVYVVPDPLLDVPWELELARDGETLRDVRYVAALEDVLDDDVGRVSLEGSWLLAGGLEYGNSTGPAAWPPLPGSKAEIEAIAGLLGARVRDPVHSCVGRELDAKRFLQSITTHRHIHLATHGGLRTDASGRHEGWIALSGANESDVEGTLRERDVDALVLPDCELVVLSACTTAVGSGTRTDGTHGLARAFLAAGARVVIAARWPVSDSGSQIFFSMFYRHLLENGGLARDAWQRTWAQMRANGTADDLFAAFVLYAGP